MSACDKGRIVLEDTRSEKDEAVAKRVRVEGLATRAKIEAKQYKKSCEAKD